MIAALTVTLSLLAESGAPLPIATFDTQAECGEVLLHLIYDAQCTGDTYNASSPRPRPRPTERTE